MFNQLSPAYMVAAIGNVLRAAARREGPPSEFERDQLLSAYSASRHLAVELESYEAELRRFVGELSRLAPPKLSARLQGDVEFSVVAATTCDLVAALRADGSREARARRAEVHALLRELADREVDLLAEGLR
ncbi:MAG: hypothetical protein ACRDLD_03655 [Thermoleophilaceae bacterium]